MDIKVKKANNDGFDFHSFRKNLSIALQDSGVGTTYINDIIGWEGKTTFSCKFSNKVPSLRFFNAFREDIFSSTHSSIVKAIADSQIEDAKAVMLRIRQSQGR